MKDISEESIELNKIKKMDNPSMSTSISQYAYHGVSSTVGAVNEGALTLSEGIISTLSHGFKIVELAFIQIIIFRQISN